MRRFLCILSLLVVSAGSAASIGVLLPEKTSDGSLFVDDFNDGVMDTSSILAALVPWQPMYADSSLDFRERDGYFQVFGNTGPEKLGQHRGIQTNPYTYRGWVAASLETLELVSVVEMRNMDPAEPAVNPWGGPAVARMAHHYCCNCCGAGGDFNATVSVGYLFGEGTGPGWNPPGGKWGFRVKWHEWSDRYLVDMDTLFGDEADRFFPTMVDNFGFDEDDSTTATGYVRRNGEWICLGSRKLDMRTCRKTELKSMCEWARNHDIDYRWDNFRLFLHSAKWPVEFLLVDMDTIPMEGDYVLEARDTESDELIDRDTLVASSNFSIHLDHVRHVIPADVDLILFDGEGAVVAAGQLPASGVKGCYPNDAWRLFCDTTSNLTGVTAAGRSDPPSLRLLPNRPNPFNPETRIVFELVRPSEAALSIHDLSGRRIVTLFEGRLGFGAFQSVWDGRDGSGRAAPSGVYFARLRAGSAEETRKLLLIR